MPGAQGARVDSKLDLYLGFASADYWQQGKSQKIKGDSRRGIAAAGLRTNIEVSCRPVARQLMLAVATSSGGFLGNMDMHATENRVWWRWPSRVHAFLSSVPFSLRSPSESSHWILQVRRHCPTYEVDSSQSKAFRRSYAPALFIPDHQPIREGTSMVFVREVVAPAASAPVLNSAAPGP